MVTDTLAHHRLYHGLSPRFAAAFEFLSAMPAELALGRHAIDGDDCFALVQTYTTLPHTAAKFEAHRRYIDIQFIQVGRETILWAPLPALTNVLQPHDNARDIAFFGLPPQTVPVALCAGEFAIFFPTDGHAPMLESNGATEVRKVVIKVRA